MRQQDTIITSLKAEELILKNEIIFLKKSLHESKLTQISNEELLLEAQQKASVAEHAVDSTKKRNVQLQARCDELGKKLEAERKLRLVVLY